MYYNSTVGPMNFLTDSVMESMMYVELAYKETKKMAHDWVWKNSMEGIYAHSWNCTTEQRTNDNR